MEETRYHINPRTGRPNICRATKNPCKYAVEGQEPPHYGSRDEARAGYEQEMARSTLVSTSRRDRRGYGSGEAHGGRGEALGAAAASREAKEALVQHLRSNGIEATLYAECALELYHEGETVPREVRSFDAEGDASNMNAMASKPTGVLWLSPGVRSRGGKVATAWNDWAVGEQWGIPRSPTVAHAQIKDDALIVELREDDLKYLDGVLAGDMVERDAPAPDSLGFSFSEHMLRGDFSRPGHWGKLQAAGVDLVRVNGATQRGYFYGWDCDSVVVLNGDAIEGWSMEEAERDEDNVMGVFQGHGYSSPLVGE